VLFRSRAEFHGVNSTQGIRFIDEASANLSGALHAPARLLQQATITEKNFGEITIEKLSDLIMRNP
jgi:hypothetical protein